MPSASVSMLKFWNVIGVSVVSFDSGLARRRAINHLG
jgi:hypothetical protein